MQLTLTQRILPLLAILGILFAAGSFIMGNENARNHIKLAVFGTIIGFGAPSIMNFLRGLIH